MRNVAPILASMLILASACSSDVSAPAPLRRHGRTAAVASLGAWTQRASMPRTMNAAAAAAAGGRVYVFGGSQSVDCTYTTAARIFDPVGNSWSDAAPMPTSRSVMDAAELNGSIYVIGGGTGCGVFTGVNEVYNIATNSWTTDAPMSARYGAMVDVVDGKIYVVGGSTNAGELSRLEMFDPVTHQWTTKAPMPTSRGQGSSTVLDGKIYVFGGCCGPARSVAVEAYDPATDTWTKKNDAPFPQDWSLAGVLNGKIYLAGVGLDHGERSLVKWYDPASDSWTDDTSLPLSLVLHFGAVVANKLYVMGGDSHGTIQTAVWEFTPGAPANVGPVADAGSDQTLECRDGSALATLDGRASHDPDGAIASYAWSRGGIVFASTPTAQLSLPLGAHEIVLGVTDGDGAGDESSVTVGVTDSRAPSIQLTAERTQLWPVNHKMVRVATVSASDQCDRAVTLDVAIASSESSNSLGDGNTSADWEIVPAAHGALVVYLRAERAGNGKGRVYTISARSSDRAGNVSSSVATVTVPLNMAR